MNTSPAANLTRRQFLATLATAALAARHLGAAAAQPKLNLIFFLVDDMGWRDAACFGSTFYETPNIDALAAQGMKFTDAYAACPVCSPTRASIMTGKYPPRTGITNFIGGERKQKLLPPPYVHELSLDELTLAKPFKEAGYTTCFIGKWHLGDKGFWPEQQGFDINIGGTSAGAPSSYFSPYRNAKLPDGPKGEYLTDRLTDEATRFIQSAKDKPFLLYFSHYAVHNPQQGKPALVEKYTAKAAAHPPAEPRFLPEGKVKCRQVQDVPSYAAMIQSMDESLGRLMKKLDELGLADNTAIIFMSDNGGLSTAEGSPTSNIPLRGGKGWLYDGGVREPLIIKWPGVTKPASVCSEPVISTDFYPTLLEMAGLPLRPKQHCDGLSLAPLLKGQAKLNREAIYWHYPHYSNQGGGPGGAIRRGDFKLIEWYETGQVELYNIKTDISEKTDLSTQMPEITTQLKKLLADWRTTVGAKMPTPNPNFKTPTASLQPLNPLALDD